MARALPVTLSMKLDLPAPFGPMMARSSAGRLVKDRLLMARKPSNVGRTRRTLQGSGPFQCLLFLQRSGTGAKVCTQSVGQALKTLERPADALGRKQGAVDEGNAKQYEAPVHPVDRVTPKGPPVNHHDCSNTNEVPITAP